MIRPALEPRAGWSSPTASSTRRSPTRAAGAALGVEEVERVNRFATARAAARPDVPARPATGRRRERAGESDRFEDEGDALQEAVLAAYERLVEAEPGALAPDRRRRARPRSVHAEVLARGRAGAGMHGVTRRCPAPRTTRRRAWCSATALASPSPRTPTSSTARPGTGKRTAARAFAAELLAEGDADPDAVRHRVRARHPSRPDLGPADRRARDARSTTSSEPVVAAATRTPFEAKPARVRARARGHDERRGRQPAAEDARGAGRVRPPDPADRRARTGARDGRLALPARALRPAAGRERSRRRWSARACRPSARAACARLALGNADRARYLASPEGEALRADVEAFVAAALDGRRRREEPWRPLLERAEARREQAEEAAAAERERAAGARAEGPRAAGDRARARGGRQARRPPRAHRGARPGADARGARPSATWSAWPRAPTTRCWPATASPALGRARAGATRAGCARRAERCEDVRQSLELNVTEDLALSALGFRLAELVGARLERRSRRRARRTRSPSTNAVKPHSSAQPTRSCGLICGRATPKISASSSSGAGDGEDEQPPEVAERHRDVEHDRRDHRRADRRQDEDEVLVVGVAVDRHARVERVRQAVLVARPGHRGRILTRSGAGTSMTASALRQPTTRPGGTPGTMRRTSPSAARKITSMGKRMPKVCTERQRGISSARSGGSSRASANPSVRAHSPRAT